MSFVVPPQKISRYLMDACLGILLGMMWLLCRVPLASADPTEHFLEYRIKEELPANTFVGDLIADDLLDRKYEPSVVSSLRFSFLTKPRPDRRFFAIDEVSGVLHTTLPIDRETICPSESDCVSQFDVAVRPIPFFRIVKVKVEILDVNDNAPQFPEQRISREILESSDVGTGLVLPAAEDLDSGDYGIRIYQLPVKSTKFELVAKERLDGSTDLKLVLKERLDREEETKYQVTVVAIDGGEPPKSGSVVVEIVVLDANDNNPVFDNATYEVRVPESSPSGSVVLKVQATDRDFGLNGLVTYHFSRHTLFEYGHLFGIRSESGKIFLKKELDYETVNVFLLSVVAADRGPDSLQSHASVLVRVEDVNDNPPRITTRTLSLDGHAEVTENAEIGSFVAYVSVVDLDSWDNGRVYCFLDSASFAPRSVQVSEFRISTAAPFDREERDSYLLTVTCADHGVPPQSSSSELSVRVLDVNDNVPKFSKDPYEATLEENSGIGLSIVLVSAVDHDLGPNGEVTYWIVDSNVSKWFEIDRETGQIRNLVVFDREERDRFEFVVVGEDQGLPVRSSEVTVRVTVTDVDDEMPEFERERYAFQVRENHHGGSLIGQVTAYDLDLAPFNQFLYSMDFQSGDYELFQVDAFTGDVFVRDALDREATASHRFSILATSGNFTTRTHVTVHVTDMNDNPPSFLTPSGDDGTVVISGRAGMGHHVTRLKAIDVDSGENSTLTYYVSGGSAQNLFAVDPATGSVTVKADLGSLVVDQAGYLLRVSVKDGGDPPLTDTAELRIVVAQGDGFTDRGVATETDGVLAVVMAMTLSVAMVSMVAVVVVIVCVIRKRGHARNMARDLLKTASSSVVIRENFRTEVRTHLDQNQLDTLQRACSPHSVRGSTPERKGPGLSRLGGQSCPNIRSIRRISSKMPDVVSDKDFLPNHSQIDIRPSSSASTASPSSSAAATAVYWMARGAEVRLEHAVKTVHIESPGFSTNWPLKDDDQEFMQSTIEEGEEEAEQLSTGKSPWKPVLCRPESVDGSHKPVIVFVKDQRDWEKSLRPGRSADVSGGHLSSDSLKFRSNMTLPVRFLQRRSETVVHRRDRSSLGPYHHHHGVVWPAPDRLDTRRLDTRSPPSPSGSIA